MDSKSALAELKNFQGTRKGANQYFDQYQGELGVGATKERADSVRGLIRNTETALKGVGEAVSGRTRGQLVTEAQRSRLANLEREPIASELSDYQGDYADEMANYRDLLGQAGTRSQLAYQTDTDRQNSLQSIYDRLYQEEQAAEAKRQWEAQQAEARRQFDAQMAARQREAQQSLARVASLLNPSLSAGGATGGGMNAAAIKKAQENAATAAYGGPSISERFSMALANPNYQKAASTFLTMNPITAPLQASRWAANTSVGKKISGAFGRFF